MGEIADRFPEACVVEARFLERLLGVPLVRGAHRLDGCGRCEYGVLSQITRWETGAGMSSSIDALVNREYQYGFTTDIEADTLPPGLIGRHGPLHLGQEAGAGSGCSTGA